jgi:AcrR family transcriptional regulator
MDSLDTPARIRRRSPGAPSRKLDPEGVKQDILDVATEEFANHGLSGARVDAIAARTRTAKHMIYYYFGSKEGLYFAVLERSYGRMRAAERELDLDQLPPHVAIRRMVEFVFDYQEAHPDFTRLVSIENIHLGKHVAQSPTIQKLNQSIIEVLDRILKRGQKEGCFRTDIDTFDLHMLCTAFAFFRVSNRYTLGTLFEKDLSEPELRARQRRMVPDSILAYLQTKETTQTVELDKNQRPKRREPNAAI